MKQLTAQEIKFVKETGVTPTVFQCNEYKKRTYKDPYWIDSYAEAQNIAREDFNIDLDQFLDKNLNIDNDDFDGISLEFVATYLFYCFFSKEELERLNPQKGLEWLQDYRYYSGFRKWDETLTCIEINEAIEAHDGERKFYLTDDGNVWNARIDEIENNEYFNDKVFLSEGVIK